MLDSAHGTVHCGLSDLDDLLRNMASDLDHHLLSVTTTPELHLAGLPPYSFCKDQAIQASPHAHSAEQDATNIDYNGGAERTEFAGLQGV